MRNIDEDEFFDHGEEEVTIESGDDDDENPRDAAFMKGYNEADDIDELFEENSEEE